ncbi:DUF4468 domain-containing protein [Sphingobacterium detergens]|uniref:Uncharacterized protein with TBP-like fold DUF4468 n=1 Tax=Sphingobacterium detergens TaxID=1145106 RepID=A0A420AFM9_SPHD1|nr:DUF4468 domain-containing protein [Sphingobacterium detergens]RKE43284.1 uncharacterized protein with TBP-like fold DUF4468 [Sphingobacterium detergens]
MKKLVFALFMLCGSHTFGQSMKITSNGFVDMTDLTKKYVIIDFPGISREQLFKEMIKFINANYERPEEITNVIANEQIVINGHDWLKVEHGYLVGGLNAQYIYKYDLQFRDGKIRFEPIFDHIKYRSNETLSLIGKKSWTAGTSGLFTEKGKVISKREVLLIDKKINEFIQSIKDKLTSVNGKDW